MRERKRVKGKREERKGETESKQAKQAAAGARRQGLLSAFPVLINRRSGLWLLPLNAQANSFSWRLFKWLPGRLELGKPRGPHTARPVTQLEKRAWSQCSQRRAGIAPARWNGNGPALRAELGYGLLRRCWARGLPGLEPPPAGPPPVGLPGQKTCWRLREPHQALLPVYSSPFCHLGPWEHLKCEDKGHFTGTARTLAFRRVRVKPAGGEIPQPDPEPMLRGCYLIPPDTWAVPALSQLRPVQLGDPRLLCPRPGKDTAVDCHFLLQEIFPTRDQTQVCCGSCMAGRFFTAEPPGKSSPPNNKNWGVRHWICIYVSSFK